MKKKIKMGNYAVAEIVGAILLLAIAVSMFAFIYINVLSDEGPGPESFSTIVGKMEDENVLFEHRRGETIDKDSKIILEIAGQTSDAFTFFINNAWNIGNRQSIPFEDIGLRPGDRVQIDGTIVDKESNSIVFWGRLQEGYVVPPFGRGGIWHFNESSGNIAHDSSGNDNHGVLKPSEVYGPQWDNSDFMAGGGSLRFDGLNDRVEVKCAYSLNMTDAISVETWIKPIFEEIKIDNKDFGASFAYNPYLINVAEELYLAIGEGIVSQEGIMTTINISSDGVISDPIDKSKYDTKVGVRPDIINVTDDGDAHIFAIAYQSQVGGTLKTFKIFSNNGSISDDALDQWNFDINDADVPKIIRISDTIYAIVYRGPDNKGIIKTFEILDYNGQITPKDEFPFNDSEAYGPNILKISDIIYVITYRDSDDKGLIQTVQIEENGQIIKIIDEADFNSISDYAPPATSDQRIKIIHTSGNYYAVVYPDSNDHGLVTTVEIDTNGYITRPVVIASLDFYDSCMEPDIIHVRGDTYAIVYATDKGGNPGQLITIEISSDDGTFGESIKTLLTSIDPPEKKDNKCYSPELIYNSDRVYTITYRSGVPHRGFLMTVRIGRDPTPPWARGIFRFGSITVYADAEFGKIYAAVNGPDQLLTINCTPGLWHHVVLTYDRFDEKICLYTNNRTRFNAYKELVPNSTEYINYNETSYNEPIILSNTFLFGNLFCGNIDEVAIFDYALNPEEINTHFLNPGIFENEP
jgi:hypothetical protein